MNALAAEGLSLWRGEKPVLQDVSLACARGEVVGIIGPNGAGKSSLLRVLAGIAAPAAGAVTVMGQPLDALPRPALARRVAYLPQSESLAWPLDTEALVALGRLPHRRAFAPADENDRRAVAVALAKCAADVFKGRAVTALSAGERARVLLARALAVEAPILLADEPAAALDPLHRLTVMDTLRREARSGTAVLVVLHDLSLAARFCDRLLLMNKGRAVFLGEPGEALRGERLQSVFGVRFLTGYHDGMPYVLPWSPT